MRTPDFDQAFNAAQDRLEDHLRNNSVFKNFPTIDFAATVFGAIQTYINEAGLQPTPETIDSLLQNIQKLSFGKKPSLDDVSNTLRDCVLGFLHQRIPHSPAPIIGPVVRHELKKAKDGVFRLFPLGHTFPKEREE